MRLLYQNPRLTQAIFTYLKIFVGFFGFYQRAFGGRSKFVEILDIFKLKDKLGVEFYSPILTRLQTHKRVFFAYAIFP